ncbi:MAG: 1-deoxy-D-xylulose-5-phosphate reductoisomerase [Elusimicrobia bacterium]|nr:1-deoxy-D-xylulose-5-phosphate reductoisomerase [Elusimicrobiota bacterium]
MKKVVILGSTGSIGTQALDVARHLIKSLKIVGLSSFSNILRLKDQIREFRPEIASVWFEKDCIELKSWCRENNLKTEVVFGIEGLIKAAKHHSSNFVLSAVVGSIGIEPLLEAIKSKKQIALANKEALVVAGKLIMDAAKKCGVTIIPVDSEHSAVFQCLKNEKNKFISKIILTASGGPFYKKSKTKHSKVTVAEALSHPTWKMGKKITIDSATLMNKGLEAIEASHLFNVPLKNIEIVIHPQSIVHSLVQFVDGSVLAQLSNPDMRLPIQYALTFPERIKSGVKELSLTRIKKLEFDVPDFKRFPSLELALKAGKTGGTMPAAMNAANEVAVEKFLKKEISFSQIPKVVKKVMDKHLLNKNPNIRQILNSDLNSRKAALKIIKEIKH